MEEFLKAVDESIKRLITPVTVIIAASFLLKGLNKPESDDVLIYSLFGLLSLWAFAYTLISAEVAIRKIYAATEVKFFAFIVCLSFLPVYIILIVAAIWLGFSKIT